MGNKRVVVTGATGFVGQHLVRLLADEPMEVIAPCRSQYKRIQSENIRYLNIETRFGSEIFIPDTVNRLDCCVHLAGRAHVMGERSKDPANLYIKNNVELTQQLLKQALHAGCKRFIYISTAKVLSLEKDKADLYSQSKLMAESTVKEFCERHCIDYIILRPPLIYGPGVGANFRKLISLAASPFPLPLGSLNNRRSMISVFNFCEAILQCIRSDKLVNEIFTVTDGATYSTRLLIQEIRTLLNRNPLLFPFPPALLEIFMKLLGKSAVAERVIGSFDVEDGKFAEFFGWKPSHTLQSTLQLML